MKLSSLRCCMTDCLLLWVKVGASPSLLGLQHSQLLG